MRKGKMYKVWRFLFLLVLFYVQPIFGIGVQAKGLEILEWVSNSEPVIQQEYSENGVGYLGYYRKKAGEETVKISISSSNQKVISIDKEDRKVEVMPGDYAYSYCSFKYYIKGVGKAVITISDGEQKIQKQVIVKPKEVEIKAVKQVGYQSAKVTWKKQSGVSGYIVQRAKLDSWEFKNIKTVSGEDTLSAVISTKWGKEYKYRVVGFVSNGKKKVLGKESWESIRFQAEEWKASISSVQKASAKKIKISWKKQKDATGYKLYRSDSENGTYKMIYKTKSKNTLSYTHTAKPGKIYYYRLVTVYPDIDSSYSESSCGIIPKNAKATTKKTTVNLSYMKTQYGWNWASADTTYYYQNGEKLHIVNVENKKLVDYVVDSKGKTKVYKKISLDYECWGGFYKGEDGKFYVAVGYLNEKESKKKTVIKVIQYDKKWKKLKTASIKGGVSNAFIGIYQPFRAGNCSMAMQGNTLYLYTARQMFQGSDGLRHQSNIAFSINTKTMKATTSNDTYVSHSFNQYARFKDGNLYLLDHGDAYPRSICYSVVNNFGTKTQRTAISEADLFLIYGDIGDNFTGCTVGGMEIGSKNVLVCGTAQPHNSKVAGVGGFDSSYKKNAYVLVADKNTGKTKVKWLTKYNPKTSKMTVGNTRMLKLAYNRYAVLYQIMDSKGKISVQYVVVDSSGKTVYSHTYKNMSFSGGTQPIVFDGKIVWLSQVYNTEKPWERDCVLNQIPAVW